MLIHLRFFDAFVFRSPILEPDFDLRFREAEHFGQFEPSRTSDVLGAVVFQL